MSLVRPPGALWPLGKGWGQVNRPWHIARAWGWPKQQAIARLAGPPLTKTAAIARFSPRPAGLGGDTRGG